MTLELAKIIALIMIGAGTVIQLITHPEAKQIHIHITVKLDTLVIRKDTIMAGGFAIESLIGPIGGVIGGLLEQQGAKQQYQDQLRLMQEQELAGRRMGSFNKQLALDLWKETNYPAQVEQMRKAGLNVGLMYKGAGPGGSTGIAPGAMPSASGAPRANLGMAIQSSLQTAMTVAQIKNIEADTLAKTAGISKTEAETVLTGLKSGSEKLDQEYKRYANQLANIQLAKDTATLGDAISQIKAGAEEMIQKAKYAQATTQIATEGKANVLSKIESDATAAALEVYLKQNQIIQTGKQTQQIEANIKKIAAEINNIPVIQNQRWTELSIEAQNTAIKDLMAKLQKEQIDFNTSTPQQMRQWLEALMSGANLAASVKAMGGTGVRK